MMPTRAGEARPAGFLDRLRGRSAAADHDAADAPAALYRLTDVTGGRVAAAGAGALVRRASGWWVAGVARRLDRPIFTASIIQNIDSPPRATVLSIVNQSVGQVGGGRERSRRGGGGGAGGGVTVSERRLLVTRAATDERNGWTRGSGS